MRVVSLLFHDVYAATPRESGFGSPAADRYKLSIPAFDAQLDGLAGVAGNAPGLATSVVDGTPGRDNAAPRTLITFDDGGSSYYTVAADRLEAHGWRGHCFVSTDFINQRGFLTAPQIRELDARGHLIGSHSASHPSRFSALSADAMRREWSDSRRALEDLLGRAVTLGSVPGGYFSRAVARAAGDAGLHILLTSEPTRTVWRVGECLILGRFTIRGGHASDIARRFVDTPWTRRRAWMGWNVKGVAKPLLGASYAHVANWFLTTGGAAHYG